MSDDAPTTDAPVDAAPVDAPATPDVAPVVNSWDGKVESLDPAVQKIITDLRKEAGDNRVKAKVEADRVAAIRAAAGIDAAAEDPVEVAKQSRQEALEAKLELAIYRAAANLADPTKLLDRNSFKSSIDGIDPADGPALRAAIEAAVAADPTLKAVRVAASSGTELGGSGEQGQITEAQLAQMTPEQIVDARKKGLLKNLL